MTLGGPRNAADALDALAAVLLPGDKQWPAASELGVGAAMLEIAGRHGGNSAVVAEYAADPLDLSDDAVSAVATLQRANPVVFGLLRALAYEAYYTHPRVQAVLAERTGWRPGPAQPEGYPRVFALDRPADVEAVLRRGVVWRPDGSTTGAAVRAAQEENPVRDWTEEEIRQWRR